MRQMTDEEKRVLGLKIKSARKQRGLSQEQLADLVGYKVGTISKYEQGYRIPGISTLRKISAALDCNLSELADASDEAVGKTTRYTEAVESYTNWLRDVHVLLTMSNYEDKDGKKKASIIVNVDGIFFDIADYIDDIMQKGKEHFELLTKHIGNNIFEN